MRRFDKEQWEEDCCEENDQGGHKNKEVNNRDNNCNSQDSVPATREMRQLSGEQLSATDAAPPVTMKELHTRAQVFSKDATARRKSIAAPNTLENRRNPPKTEQAVVMLRRVSIADFRGKSDGVIFDKEEATHVDARAIGGYPEQEEEDENAKKKQGEVEEMEIEKGEKGQATAQNQVRLELLRAISTPSSEKTLISNLTFVNETQELSAINMDSTGTSSKALSGELQLHPSSPTDCKRESEFSRLRRTSKELSKESAKTSKEKAREKRPKVSGGLFESYEAESSQSDGESTCESDVSAASAKSVSKKLEGKRTRHMASLSPDPEKTASNRYTEKPKQKKHRKKT